MTLLELFKLLKKHLALVVALPVVLAIATAGVSWGVLQNQYTATVSVYVLTSKDSESSSNTTAYNDLTASQLMANDIAMLAESATVKEKTAQSLGMDSLSGYKISVESQHHHARDRHLGDGGQGRCGLHCGERDGCRAVHGRPGGHGGGERERGRSGPGPLKSFGPRRAPCTPQWPSWPASSWLSPWWWSWTC